jgi:hypothetical protein
LEAEEVLDLEAVDLGRPGEIELLERFEDGKAGRMRAALARVILALLGFAIDEFGEEVEMRPGLFRGQAGEFREVFMAKVQTQVEQLLLQAIGGLRV